MQTHLLLLVVGLVVAVVGVGIAIYSLPMWKVHEVPWGLLVALYEFEGVLGAGSAIIASLLLLAVVSGLVGVEAERAARLGLILAFAALVTAGFTVALKSGFPETIMGAFFRIKTDSAIGRMLILLPLLTILTAVTYIVSIFIRDSNIIKAVLAALTGIVAVLAYANAGSVFQSMGSVSLWHSTPLTALFIAGAIAWGSGAKSLYVLIAERRIDTRLSKIYGGAIVLGVLAYTATLYFTSLGYASVAAEAWSKITGSVAYQLFLLLGFLVPLVLGLYTMITGNTVTLVVSAISAIVGGFLMHTMLVIAPQTLALTGFREIEEIQYHLAGDEIVGAIGSVVLLAGLIIAGLGLTKFLEAKK